MATNLSSMLDPSVYTIAAALRGPDVSTSDAIKYAFTARLRTFVFGSHASQFGFILLRTRRLLANERKTVVKEVRRWAKQDANGLIHFFHHVADAAEVLQAQTRSEAHKRELAYMRTLADTIIGASQNTTLLLSLLGGMDIETPWRGQCQ